MKLTSIAIAGAGRMGETIADSITQCDDLDLAGVWARGEDLEALVARSDLVIDFSLPQGTEAVLATLANHPRPLVCGVSGFNERQYQQLVAIAEHLPVVYDRNMSLGIAVLERSVREAAASLGVGFEIEINEVHHVDKRDSPSGTALKLGEAISTARQEADNRNLKFTSERRGEVPGDHSVSMHSATERLNFTHSVTTRQVFADGALRAARWVLTQEAGLFSMQDVLF